MACACGGSKMVRTNGSCVGCRRAGPRRAGQVAFQTIALHPSTYGVDPATGQMCLADVPQPGHLASTRREVPADTPVLLPAPRSSKRRFAVADTQGNDIGRPVFQAGQVSASVSIPWWLIVGGIVVAAVIWDKKRGLY